MHYALYLWSMPHTLCTIPVQHPAGTLIEDRDVPTARACTHPVRVGGARADSGEGTGVTGTHKGSVLAPVDEHGGNIGRVKEGNIEGNCDSEGKSITKTYW
jgi:hypothetical protein